MSTIDKSKLRNFIQPPSELQETIEEVAAAVAERGSGVEFQLRTGVEGQRQFPFLYLDNEYAPFYQYKLGEARSRRRTSEIATESEKPNRGNRRLTAHNSSSDGPIRGTGVEGPQPHTVGAFKLGHDGTDDTLHEKLLLAPIINAHDPNPTGNATENNHKTDAACSRVNTNSPSELSASIPNPTQQSYLQQSSELLEPPYHESNPPVLESGSLNDSALADNSDPLTTTIQGVIPYGPLDEVHLLDSSGTERSGLNTFVVVSNGDGNDLIDYMNRSTELSLCEPVYRVRPDIQTMFRVPHHRLLPVGLGLGAEVKQLDNSEPGIIVKRTVKQRQRLYDVKDAVGVLHEDVPEEMLQAHTGGTFDFGMPSKF